MDDDLCNFDMDSIPPRNENSHHQYNIIDKDLHLCENNLPHLPARNQVIHVWLVGFQLRCLPIHAIPTCMLAEDHWYS